MPRPDTIIELIGERMRLRMVKFIDCDSLSGDNLLFVFCSVVVDLIGNQRERGKW